MPSFHYNHKLCCMWCMHAHYRHMSSLSCVLYCVFLGLCTSYDHQLDEEAAEYTKAQEEIHSIVNDVGFRQALKIEKQETLDKSLPPIGARPRPLDHAQDRLINAQPGSGIAPKTQHRSINALPRLDNKHNIQQRLISIRPRLDDTPTSHLRKQEKLPPIKLKSLQSKSSYLEMYEKTKAKRQTKCQPKSATKRVHFRDPVWRRPVTKSTNRWVFSLCQGFKRIVWTQHCRDCRSNASLQSSWQPSASYQL